jgi:hypothetical protein
MALRRAWSKQTNNPLRLGKLFSGYLLSRKSVSIFSSDLLENCCSGAGESIMKIPTLRTLMRFVGLGATAAVALSALAGCASSPTATSDADWSSRYAMRYYGGPKQPMYPAPRE